MKKKDHNHQKSEEQLNRNSLGQRSANRDTSKSHRDDVQSNLLSYRAEQSRSGMISPENGHILSTQMSSLMMSPKNVDTSINNNKALEARFEQILDTKLSSMAKYVKRKTASLEYENQ